MLKYAGPISGGQDEERKKKKKKKKKANMLVAKWGIITLWIDVKENHLLVIARENVQTPSR